MRRFWILVLSGALAFAATAIGPGRAISAAEELKIGVIGPMSGPGAPWGIALLRGVEMATNDINAAGGIKAGGKSYQVKIISADDKYTGKGGVDAAMKLVHQDQVKYIIGSISSASVLAFQPITEPAKVLVMPDSYANEVLSPDKPYSFRIVMTSHEICKVQYKWIKDNRPNVKKVAIINPNDASGWAVSKHSKMGAESNGMKVVFNDYYERGTVDFYPLLNKVLPLKPDWLDLSGSAPGDQGLMLKQARELGFVGGASTPTGIDPDSLIKIAGAKAVEGYMGPNLDFDGPFALKEEREFQKKYIDKYGAPFNPIALSFYYPLYILKQGIEQVNSIDTTLVMKKMAERGWKYKIIGKEGWWGGKEYYGTDRQMVFSIAVSIIDHGKIKTLERFWADDVAKLLK
jgi:branched-chain amino acid transport system substrate-binding protein